MSASDTPRTDALIFAQYKEQTQRAKDGVSYLHYKQFENLARTLERDLAARTAQAEMLSGALDGTLYLFEARVVTQAEQEQLTFARTALRQYSGET